MPSFELGRTLSWSTQLLWTDLSYNEEFCFKLETAAFHLHVKILDCKSLGCVKKGTNKKQHKQPLKNRANTPNKDEHHKVGGTQGFQVKQLRLLYSHMCFSPKKLLSVRLISKPCNVHVSDIKSHFLPELLIWNVMSRRCLALSATELRRQILF